MPRRGRRGRRRRRCASTRWVAAGAVARPVPARHRRRRATRAARRGVEVVRRPTGGRALLHGADLTYAVAMPRPAGRGRPRRRALPDARRRARSPGSAELGVRRPRSARDRGRGRAGVLRRGAGRGPAGGGAQALRLGPGPARRASVLQHGSILLDRLPFDELDLLARPDAGGARTRADGTCGPRSVTMRELGCRAPRPGGGGGRDRRRASRPTLDVDVRVEGRRRSTVGSHVQPRPRVSTSGSGCSLVVMICGRCGHRNEPGARFCSSCGAALVEAEETTLSHTAFEDRDSTGELEAIADLARRARARHRRRGARTRAAPTWSTTDAGQRRPPPRLQHLPRRHHGVAPPRGHRAGRRRVPDPGRRVAQRHLREPRPGRHRP